MQKRLFLLARSLVIFALVSCGSSTRAGDSGASDSETDSAAEGCTLPDGRRIAIGAFASVDCNMCSCTAMGLGCTLAACGDAGSGMGTSDAGASRCDPVVTPFSGVCGAAVQYPCGTPGGPLDPMVPRARCAELCVPAAMQFPALRITDDCIGIPEQSNTVSCRCGPMR